MKRLSLVAALGAWLFAAGSVRAADYVILVSGQTAALADWNRVVSALQLKHRAEVIQYTGPLESLLPWKRPIPHFVCFVAQPTEVTREFVMTANRFIRRLDDDPWPDAVHGILTGFDAANALQIASDPGPLTVHKVAAGTSVALDQADEGLWYCELKQGRTVRKDKGGQPVESRGPADTTAALAATLNDYHADLFVTSGHATERDWQIGFAYPNGSFRSAGGELLGRDLAGLKIPIASANPKVYLPIGNCLMGHIDGPDAMALAWMKSAGVRQMIGYTLPTWYGYAGWGMLDYFVEQPGRYTLAEAWLANEIALLHRLQTVFPDLLTAEVDDLGNPRTPVRGTTAAGAVGLSPTDGQGLLFDRDVVAFYGDPAWIARMAPQPPRWTQTLVESNGVFTLTIEPRQGDASYRPINLNGSQRGGRPFIEFFPRPIRNARVLEGADLQPVVNDTFILVPRPADGEPARPLRVVFTAGNPT